MELVSIAPIQENVANILEQKEIGIVDIENAFIVTPEGVRCISVNNPN